MKCTNAQDLMHGVYGSAQAPKFMVPQPQKQHEMVFKLFGVENTH